MSQETRKEHNATTAEIDATTAEIDPCLDDDAEQIPVQDGEIIELDDAEVSDETDVIEEVKEEKKPETDWRDAYIRIAADFDNYRKRTSKEFDDVRRRERERVINAWLEVYDNTERAIAALPEKSGPWYEGFQSLLKQMDKCLASFNIRVVDDQGKAFDPNRHEAIATMPSPEHENNTILFVERQGFAYENGDIARVARVVVVKNPS